MESQYTARLRQNLLAQEYEESFVNRCCQYAERLIKKNLPVFFDEEHVSRVLRTRGMPNGFDYHFFTIETSHKMRIITAPSKRLKLRQRWILDHILNRVKISPCAHGFEPGRSIKTHAELHANNDYVICMDIRDFFPSIREERIIRLFNNLGYTKRVARKLAKLCCYAGALPQGAPSSPKLANIVCKAMDRQILRYAKEHGIVYSRYADDLTFSSKEAMPDVISDITAILQHYGFTVNADKTQSFSGDQPKFITGLVVQNGLVRIPKSFKRELKKEIHYCQRFGVLIHLQNTGSTRFFHYREHLYGKAYYVHMIEPEIGERFLRELDKIDWPDYML